MQAMTAFENPKIRFYQKKLMLVLKIQDEDLFYTFGDQGSQKENSRKNVFYNRFRKLRKIARTGLCELLNGTSKCRRGKE